MIYYALDNISVPIGCFMNYLNKPPNPWTRYIYSISYTNKNIYVITYI